MAPRYIRSLRPMAERHPSFSSYSLKTFAKNVGTGTNDYAKVNDTIAAIADVGGGEIVIDSKIIIGTDVSCPRSVVPGGVSPTSSIIFNNGTQRRFQVTGVPSDAPGFNGDFFEVRSLAFDGVSLDFAPGAGDVGRGARAAGCQFINSDHAVKFENLYDTCFAGVGLRNSQIRLCNVGVLFNRGGPHSVISDCDISECDEAAIKVDGGVPDGISLAIDGVYSDHSARFLKVVGSPTTDGKITILARGTELCGTADLSTTYPGGVTYPSGHYTDAYALENEWAQIWVKDLNFFSGPNTTAMFWNKGGTIYLEAGRYQTSGYFARIDGGTIIFHQEDIFSNFKLWGETFSGAFAHPSSSGGIIVAPRAGYVGRFNTNLTQLTSGTPQQLFEYAAPFDGNDREWECDVTSAANGSENALRLEIADGVHSIHIDLVFPVVAGGGKLRIVNKQGVEFSASMIYAASGALPAVHAAGNPPTQTEYNLTVDTLDTKTARFCRATTADSSTTANSRFITFNTIAFSGTKSSITVTNLIERISGPSQVGI